MTDEVKINRGTVEGHADDTRATLGRVADSRQAVDRQHGNRLAQFNGGIGTDEAGRGRGATRRTGEDIDTGVNNTTKQVTEGANDFISRTRSAAQGNL